MIARERQLATETARNVLNSKIAKAMLVDNRFPERNLKLEMDRIDSDLVRQQAIHDNEQRLFKKQGLLYNFEPTMVVERPASPIHYGDTLKPYEDTEETPHYMTGLERKRPQGYLPMPTVDAFKVHKKRKRNLWENKYTEKDLNEKFRSIILKSPPLTEPEQFDLEKGWSVYRPVSRMEESIRETLRQRKEERQRLAKSVKMKPSAPEASSVFITQLNTEQNIHVSARQGRRNTIVAAISSKGDNASKALTEREKKEAIKQEMERQKLNNFLDMRQKARKKFDKYMR